MASLATPAPSHKQPRVLACVLCQHRKIKCDRNSPCSNCIKANVTCTPSTPAPARKRRRPNQDLQERLAKCEELLKQYAGQPVPLQGSQTPPERFPSHPASEPATTSPLSTDSHTKWQTAGKVVHDESGVRFMDNYLWATVYEELQAMKDIIDTDDPDELSVLGSEDRIPDNNSDTLFPYDVAAVNADDLPPDSTEVFRLWQLFLDRVNPLTKIIHVPTVQPYIIEALTNMENIPVKYQALLYSIYTMAVISLSELECLQMLGMDREKALRRFAAGMKMALNRYNFLKNHDMTILQSLVFYLYSLQGRYDRHAAWIISGTVLRIAQKMGYHRDGELFNLDTFETEMRRRIWWQILLQDAKNAVSSGLSHALLPVNWDTKEPSNLNDTDLIPGSRERIPPREGPSEMGFCILIYRIANFMISTANNHGHIAFDAAILGEDTEEHRRALSQYQLMITELEKALKETEDKYIDKSLGGAHAAAATIRPKIIGNLRELLTPMRQQPEWGTEIFGTKDNMFKVLIINNENAADAFKDLQHAGFLWFAKMHVQLDVFAVMTGQLCQHPTGVLADRAWGTIERMHLNHTEMMDLSHKTYILQAQLTLKAWRVREQAFAQQGKAIQMPPYLVQLQENLQMHESRQANKSTATTPSVVVPPADLDQFIGLGGYLDVASLNWDVWGDMSTDSEVPMMPQMNGQQLNGQQLNGQQLNGDQHQPRDRRIELAFDMIAQRVGVAAMRRGAAQPSVFLGQHIPKLAVASGLTSMQTRRVATTKVSDKEASQILANQRLNRPIAPHLAVYKFNQTWFSASVWNRITGCTLSGAAYVYFAGYLVAPLLGWHWESASVAAAFSSLPFAVQGGIKSFLSFPFVYHCIQGVRHLTYDLGIGYKKTTIRAGETTIWISTAVIALGLAFLV
ncbi:hypothetical protein S7711_05001 [Stachybotrys chartarum IBT 7711]|uniref:Zn(2)-C6 fungal-type domain-containing protein n=1 Tax=Stachybotrys chartarum (strain CBS 109288 / IBT 7711) TaxID=1280523 RepID=A0A084ARD5_STACB|nr:hypothetical protein S7711_05001 [Stachybotrys chartarum IBT 7711]